MLVQHQRRYLLDRFQAGLVLSGGVCLSRRIRMDPLGRRTQVLNTSPGDRQPTGSGSTGSAVTGRGLRKRGREGELGVMDGEDEASDIFFIPVCCRLFLSFVFFLSFC